jgi:hypothetical protein
MLLAQSHTHRSSVSCDFTQVARFDAPYLEEVAIRKGIVRNSKEFNDLFAFMYNCGMTRILAFGRQLIGTFTDRPRRLTCLEKSQQR